MNFKLIAEFISWELKKLAKWIYKQLPYFTTYIILFLYFSYYYHFLVAICSAGCILLFVYITKEIIKYEWEKFKEERRKK